MDSKALLHFPKPPFRIDQSLATSPPPDTAIATYLEQIRAWHSAVLQFLDSIKLGVALDVHGLSTRAQSALATFMQVEWPEEMTRYAVHCPYNISAFPARALEPARTPNLEDVMEVLRWRAAVEDYLGDIWDVMGDPFLGFDECIAIGQFLSPACSEKVCSFCLTEIAPEKLNVDAHNCFFLDHIRAKWPAPPACFQRWATKPEQPSVPEDTSTDARILSPALPGKWWQFWK
jgi:hypothetical protein